jgi:hypothetical protein
LFIAAVSGKEDGTYATNKKALKTGVVLFFKVVVYYYVFSKEYRINSWIHFIYFILAFF